MQLSTAILAALFFFTVSTLARPHKQPSHQTLQTLLSASMIFLFVVSLNSRRWQHAVSS